MSENQREEKFYTPTEVGTLIERFETNLSLVAERVGTLCEDMAIVKEDVRDLKTRMIRVEDVLRIAIPDLYSRVTALEAQRS